LGLELVKSLSEVVGDIDGDLDHSGLRSTPLSS
jgi:hypothetical protein